MPDTATALSIIDNALSMPIGPNAQGPSTPAIPANGEIPQFSAKGQPLAPMIVGVPRTGAPATPQAPADPFSQKLAILDAGSRGALPDNPSNVPMGANGKPALTGIVANAGAGANEAIASTAGAPTDLMGKALKFIERLPYALAGGNPDSPDYWKQAQPTQDAQAMAKGHQAFGQAMDNPYGGSNTVKDVLGLVGADPRNVAPADQGEALARAMGSGAASMVLPYAGARTALVASDFAPGTVTRQALDAMGNQSLARGATTAPPTLTRSVLDALGNGSTAGNAAIGAASGAAGYAAGQAVDPKYQQLATFLGQLAGGGAGAGAMALGKAGARAAGDLASGFVAPFNVGAKDAVTTSSATGEPIMATAAQQRLAGQQIRDRASGPPGALQGQLDVDNPELVAGSQPTTYQLTGNPGIGQLEREKSTANVDLFNTRRADQNAARVSAIDSLSDNGNPGAVGRFVRQQLGALADRDEAAVATAQQAAQDARDAIGGTGRPQDYGATLRGSLSDLRDAAKARTSALWQAIDPDGSLAIDVTPTRQAAFQIRAGVGPYAKAPEGDEGDILALAQRMPSVVPFKDISDLRSRLNTAIADARSGPAPDMQSVRRMTMLRQAMDDTIATGAERQAQQEAQAVQTGQMAPQDTIVGRLGQTARQVPSVVFPEAPTASVAGAGGNPVKVTFPDRDHADLYAYGQRVAQGQGSAAARNSLYQRFKPWVADDFKGPQDVDSLATDYVDTAHDLARNPKAAAPVELPSVVDSDLVADWHRQRYENARLAAGASGAVEAAQVPPEGDLLTNLRRKAQDWYADRNAAVVGQRAQAGTGGDAGQGAGGIPGQGPSALPSSSRATGQSGRRSGNAPGNPGLPGQEPLTPNFDAEASARYRAAADAHRQERQTFGAGPVGQVLRPGPNRTAFRVPDSVVGGKFFNAGSHSAEDVQAFMRAAGSRQDAIAALQDYAAADLRRYATGADGMLDATRLQRWVAQHQDALAPFPELAQRFRNAGAAQQVVDEASASRLAMAKARQGYAAQQVVNGDPVKAVGNALRDPREMFKLVRWAGLDKTGEATEGLRAAAVDLMKQRFLSNAAAGDTGTTFLKADGLQTFIRNNRAGLSVLFPGERMQTLENVAADLQRAATSNTTKLPASPGTAQDLIASARHAAESGHDGGNMFSYLTALMLEHGTGSWLPAIGGAIGVKMASALRTRGIHTVDDLVTEAMLHPDVAKTLLMKAPPQVRPAIMKRLGNQLEMLTAATAAQGQSDDRRKAARQ